MAEKRRAGAVSTQDLRRRRGSGDAATGRYYSAVDDGTDGHRSSRSSIKSTPMRDLHSFPGFPRRAAADVPSDMGASPGIAQRPTRINKLPAHMIGPQLQRKLESDRVVFVQGYTGSGKSSQIPQILLDSSKPWFTSGDGKVLCTQPRRLAVAAVARRVAQERRCKLGEEVGYSIGQQSLRSTKTRLLFSTAGIALEMLRAVGPEALLEFAVIIVDEIHERSEQSDLLLTCLREYMLHDKRLRSLRLVLMSATFDRIRYSQYFQDLSDGGKPMHTLPIPKNVGKLLGQHLHQVKTKYLQDAIELLDTPLPTDAADLSTRAQKLHEEDQEFVIDSPLSESERQLAWNFDPDTEERTVTRAMHQLVARLLYRLHGPGNVDLGVSSRVAAVANEDSIDSTALVFLPTYRTLEEQHQLLTQLGCFRIAVLHSSVDIEESLRSIGALGGDTSETPMNGDGQPDEAAAAELRKPKIILATNVAESSLTIPGVSLVIDLCRRLQVSWDRDMGVTKAETKWASKSQCDQRQGRTGRCNAGTVYRLVPQQFFSNGVIQLWEPAELMLSDLAESALLLATAAHRTMRAVERIMALCIDKPNPHTVTDAIQRLIGWGLLRAKDRKATTFGAVIGQLPVSLQAGRLAVIGCCVGLMQPSSVLAAILSTTPEPILKSLGAREEHEESLCRFSGRPVAAANRCGSLLAQLAAFEWWEAAWVDRQRVRKLGVTLADPPCCTICAEILSSADLLFMREQSGTSVQDGVDSVVPSTSICLECHAKQQGHQSAATLTPHGESSEERWCRREKLSLVALRAVKQTAEVVRAVLTKADVRQALWDPRNRHCPPALWPARAVDRAVDCSLLSVMDPVGDGEVVQQLQQLVETVVASPHVLAGPSRDQLLVETERLGMDPVRVPPCKFFSLGGGNCWEGGGPGNSCPFRHLTLKQERPPNCPFFYAPGGCRYGSSCRMTHPQPELLDELRLASKIVAGRPAYDSVLASQRLNGGGSLRQILQGKNVMLVGEGDFSFALALASVPPRPARLLASGLDDEASMLHKYSYWPVTAAALQQLAVVRHGVDATLLGESEYFRDILKSSTVVLDVIGWQFPNGLNEEDSAANATMIGAFLHSVATAAWAHNRVDAGLRVFITVQGDQAARWNIVRSARDAMWYLEELFAFDLNEFDGYSPKRTVEPQEALQLTRPLTLVFRPCKPLCFGSDPTVASGWDTESCDEDNENDQTLEDAVEEMIGGGVDIETLQTM